MKIYYDPKLKALARTLRNNSTLAEILLWNELKGRKVFGYQFMRQKPIGDFIVDFFCSRLRLVIEIDSKAGHRFKLTEDLQRQQEFEKLGLTVLRFEENTVRKNIKDVLFTIEGWVDQFEQQSVTQPSGD